MIDRTRLKEWVDHAFDHPAGENAWFHGENVKLWRGDDEQIAQLITATFEQSGELLQRFSDAQVASGFEFILSAGASGYTNTLREPGVPWPVRQRAIRSFVAPFEQVIRVRAPSIPVCADEDGVNALNECAVFWWGNLGWESDWWGEADPDPHQSDFDDEIFAALEHVVQIPHDACRESAVIGLAHWVLRDRERATRMLDAFLAEANDAHPKLIEWATKLRDGERK